MVFEEAGVGVVPLWPTLPMCERASVEAPLPALSPLVFDILGDVARFELREVPNDSLASTCRASFALQDASGRLQVDSAWLDGVCKQAGLARPPSVDWSQVPPSVRIFLLSCLLAGLFERLEMLFGDMPSLQAQVRPMQVEVESRRVAMTPAGKMEPQAACIWLDLPKEAMRRLPREHAGKEDGFLRWLTVQVSLQTGRQTLYLDQLVSLKTGDVVLLSRPLDGLHLSLSASLRLDVREREEGYVVTTPWYLDEQREVAVETINPGADADQAGVLDQLTVELVCEVGHISMRLSALKSLSVGSVLPMARRADQAVDLIVNGRKIGQGELVRLDDELGVRVTRLADAHG